MYRLVAVDVDGTLLTSTHELTPRVQAAVRAAHAQGVHVALATGKLLRSVAGLIETLALHGPQVTCNGAAIMPAAGGQPLALWPLKTPALTHALRALRQADSQLGIAWYTTDAIYTDATVGPLDAILAAYHEPPLLHVPALDRTLPTPAKLLVTGTPERLAALRATVTPQLDGVAQLITTTPDFLEIFSLRASKGVGLRDIMRRLRVRPEEVLAIGDGENDVALLAAAGGAVAMANAVPALRAHAHYQTASNDADGVALVLEAVLAGRPLRRLP